MYNEHDVATQMLAAIEHSAAQSCHTSPAAAAMQVI